MRGVSLTGCCKDQEMLKECHHFPCKKHSMVTDRCSQHSAEGPKQGGFLQVSVQEGLANQWVISGFGKGTCLKKEGEKP